MAQEYIDELESGADTSDRDREAAKENIKNLTRNPRTRPKVLFMAGILVFGLVFGYFMIHNSGKKNDLSEASITTPAVANQGVGLNDKTTQAYRDLEREEDRRRAAEAEKSGGAHFELPQGKDVQEVAVVPQPEQLRPAPAQNVQYQGYQQAQYVRDQSMDSGMKSQWQSLSAAWVSKGGSQKLVKEPTNNGANSGQGNAVQMNGGPINLADPNQVALSQPQSGTQAEDTDGKYIRVRAGTVYMAVTKLESNSDDANTDSIATITNGPLRNATVIGAFSKANSNNAKTMTLKFTTLSPVWDGESVGINGLAIDADSAKKGMATDVDNHYWLRYGLPLAAGFIQGIGEAASRSASVINSSGLGSTTTMGQLDFSDQLLVGAGRAGQVVSSDLQRRAQVQPTIKIAAGTPIAIVFMSDVRVKVPESEAIKLKLP